MGKQEIHPNPQTYKKKHKKDGKLLIGDETVLEVPGVRDGAVTAGIRPEGFVLDGNGPFACDLTRVEVMGRDISVISAHPSCKSGAIRSIIQAENRVDTSAAKVHFALKPAKVLLFDPESEERLRF